MGSADFKSVAAREDALDRFDSYSSRQHLAVGNERNMLVAYNHFTVKKGMFRRRLVVCRYAGILAAAACATLFASDRCGGPLATLGDSSEGSSVSPPVRLSPFTPYDTVLHFESKRCPGTVEITGQAIIYRERGGLECRIAYRLAADGTLFLGSLEGLSDAHGRRAEVMLAHLLPKLGNKVKVLSFAVDSYDPRMLARYRLTGELIDLVETSPIFEILAGVGWDHGLSFTERGGKLVVRATQRPPRTEGGDVLASAEIHDSVPSEFKEDYRKLAQLFLLSPKERDAKSAEATQREIVKAWDSKHFSNPKEHDPKKFQYVVFGLPPGEFIEGRSAFFPASMTTNLLANPEKIAEKPILSTSIVNETHTETFRDDGFILDVPAANVIACRVTDMGTRNADENPEQEKSRLRSLFPLQAPEKLLRLNAILAKANHSVHNEVVVSGSTEDVAESPFRMPGWTTSSESSQQVSVKAVFLKVGADGKPLSPAIRVRELEKLANRLRVPVVKIPARPAVPIPSPQTKSPTTP